MSFEKPQQILNGMSLSFQNQNYFIDDDAVGIGYFVINNIFLNDTKLYSCYYYYYDATERLLNRNHNL